MKTVALRFGIVLLALTVAAPFSFSQVRPPAVSAEREAARKAFVELRMDYNAETLVKQAGEGDIVAVKLLLAAGMNADAAAIYDFGVGVYVKEGVGLVPNSEKDTATALISAAANGQAEILQVLLAAKADVDRKTLRTGHTALMRAAERGHLEAVRVLLAAGAAVNAQWMSGRTALMEAADNGHAAIVRDMLDKGADMGIGNGENGTALLLAVRKGHSDVARLLLEHGADVNTRSKQGETPLHAAATRSRSGPGEALVALLLDKRADVNAIMDPSETPLAAAIAAGSPNAVRLLLDKGADVNKVDRYNNTPLFSALRTLEVTRRANGAQSENQQRTDVVSLLIARGSDVNLGPRKTDDTPLTLAAGNGWADVVKALIDKGADVNAGARSNTTTPLKSAGKHDDVARLLVTAGAK